MQINLETLKLYGNQALDLLTGYTPKIIGAILALWIGFKVANSLGSILEKLLDRKEIDETVERFLVSLLKNILKAVIVVAAVGMLGVETTSLAALIASVGLAVGMAMSGTLSHFASGVMILLFKPYRVGDLIDAAGSFGTVKEVQIFNTILTTQDAKTIIIPNSIAIGGTITNYSMENKKRVDIDVGISYGDSIDKAREVLHRIADEDDRVLHDKGITIGVKELGDNAVIFTFRVWVKTADYWDVFFGLTEKVKKEFDATNGELNFPFPQRDIHLFEQKNIIKK